MNFTRSFFPILSNCHHFHIQEAENKGFSTTHGRSSPSSIPLITLAQIKTPSHQYPKKPSFHLPHHQKKESLATRPSPAIHKKASIHISRHSPGFLRKRTKTSVALAADEPRRRSPRGGQGKQVSIIRGKAYGKKSGSRGEPEKQVKKETLSRSVYVCVYARVFVLCVCSALYLRGGWKKERFRNVSRREPLSSRKVSGHQRVCGAHDCRRDITDGDLCMPRVRASA